MSLQLIVGNESSCVFFFQAEDGIRDTSVTGVQTCALPILSFPVGSLHAQLPLLQIDVAPFERHHLAASQRSEERRVGKECTARVRPRRQKKESRRGGVPPESGPPAGHGRSGGEQRVVHLCV